MVVSHTLLLERLEAADPDGAAETHGKRIRQFHELLVERFPKWESALGSRLTAAR